MKVGAGTLLSSRSRARSLSSTPTDSAEEPSFSTSWRAVSSAMCWDWIKVAPGTQEKVATLNEQIRELEEKNQNLAKALVDAVEGKKPHGEVIVIAEPDSTTGSPPKSRLPWPFRPIPSPPHIPSQQDVPAHFSTAHQRKQEGHRAGGLTRSLWAVDA